MCLKGLWGIGRSSNESGNTAPLSPYIYGAFTNLVITGHIHEEHDPAVRVIGRCVGALVANKLAADIISRNVLVSDETLKCLSVILGIKIDGVRLLLRHPGAIEFMNVVFLSLDDFDPFASAGVPLDSDVADVAQQTFDVLSRALPAELSAAMQLDQTGTLMNISNGQCELILYPIIIV